MEEVTYVRNPYPVPDVVREGVWTRRPVLGNKVAPQDKSWSANLKSHERLFAHHTLNSIRKDARLMRLQVPEDALDLALSTVYVHSKDTLVPKVYVTMQPETLGKKTWRVLKNEIEVHKRARIPSKDGEEEDPVSSLLAQCYRGPVPERRVHPSSVKLNITGPHSVQSNPGYSRKIDGTFYSI
ncbi:cilia- and flagella-associated protein 276 [Nomia melanderi]|uniref:cilia- and flagella-associated protein 276 n=1 Tax=Nomia melanderi TaxID=2448451 RepID=UPI001303F67E|nr:protein C1orf194 [Nomia melanderi]XP_031833230.1 protein C1orf194 [Nomia melanderi]XP_031833231.1 protein C1orf194 [Nomia melanderi]